MKDKYRIQYELDKFVSFAGKQIGADIAYVDTSTGERLAEGRVNIDFNKYGEVETSSLDIRNQAPEVFNSVFNQHKDGQKGALQLAHITVTHTKRLLENIANDLPGHVHFHAVENNITPKIERAYINEFEDEGFAIYELEIDVDGKKYDAILNLSKDEDGKYRVSKDGDSYDIVGGLDGTNKEIKEAIEAKIKSAYGEKAYEEGYGLKATEAVLDILQTKIDTKLESDQRPKEPELAKKQKKGKNLGLSM